MVVYTFKKSELEKGTEKDNKMTGKEALKEIAKLEMTENEFYGLVAIVEYDLDLLKTLLDMFEVGFRTVENDDDVEVNLYFIKFGNYEKRINYDMYVKLLTAKGELK